MSGRFIVLGDPTSHGGKVLEASVETKIGGKGFARVGDKVSCPRCRRTTVIASGDNSCLIDGKAAAREGDVTACGAKLIASQALTFDRC